MTTTDDTRTTTTGFAARLREETSGAHGDAEGSPFLTGLLDGSLGLAAHVALLAQSHLLYEVLERAARTHVGHPVAGGFVTDDLTRLPALRADLRALVGPAWREHLVALPATARYVDRLQEVAFSWPAGFVAHHYLRYLGDLSGGQVLRTLLGRTYGLGPEQLAFYTFPAIGKPRAFKDAYRARLDATGWSAAEQDRVVAEVRTGYALNRAVFDDLDAWARSR